MESSFHLALDLLEHHILHAPFDYNSSQGEAIVLEAEEGEGFYGDCCGRAVQCVEASGSKKLLNLSDGLRVK